MDTTGYSTGVHLHLEIRTPASSGGNNWYLNNVLKLQGRQTNAYGSKPYVYNPGALFGKDEQLESGQMKYYFLDRVYQTK